MILILTLFGLFKLIFYLQENSLYPFNFKMVEYEYLIEKSWDNQTLNHDPVKISLEKDPSDSNILLIKIDAPFFNDPAKPSQKPGEFFNLWDYEVAEAFFLSDSDKYLELEFGPYGHYIAILFNGMRKTFKEGLKIDYNANINGNRWTGLAKIPEAYFPLKVTKMNAYSIHGTDKSRSYEALYPVPFQKFESPDFHRLEYFREIDFQNLLPFNWQRTVESDYWLNKN